MKMLKLINPRDNVVIGLDEIAAGETARYEADGATRDLTCRQAVPFGHKVAITAIAKGAAVVKYGEEIGVALEDIAAGDWLHVHNVKDVYEVK